MNYQKSLFEPTFLHPGQNTAPSNPTFSFANTESSGLQNTLGNTYADRADLMTYLEKDFNSTGKEEDLGYKGEMLKNEVKHIQNILPAFGFPACGDLFNTSLPNIEATVKCISALLNQRQKDLEFRQEVYEKIQKVENEKNNVSQSNERLAAQKRNIESEMEKLINKHKMTEKTLKEERERFIGEKEELNKLIAKLQSKEVQYMHELRGKENNYKKLQDQLKKLTDKNVVFKNSFEATSTLESKGPILFSGNSESEFTKMISNGYEDIRSRLVAENELLREALSSIQKELFEILEQKKELLLKRRKIELGEENKEDFDFSQNSLLPLKKELFEMPTQTVGKEAIECLQENIRRFKEYMGKIDAANRDLDGEYNLDVPAEFEKIKCVKGLKNLLKNYKCIVEAQDGMINKAIMKQQNVKNPEEIVGSMNRFRVIDDKELENVKQFLHEQKRFLEAKNTEIELAKSTISATTKKFDEEKMVILQKRQETENEAQKFRKNIQDIMSKNKVFLGSMVLENGQENIVPNTLENEFQTSF